MMYRTPTLIFVLFAAQFCESKDTPFLSHRAAASEVTFCNTSLSLRCPDNHVVTAEVYAISTDPPPTVNDGHSQCEQRPDDCLAEPVLLLADIRRCVWQNSLCSFQTRPAAKIPLKPGGSCVSGRTGSYLIAKNFRCAAVSDLYGICEDRLITGNSGYIYTPNYPAAFGANLDCTLTIDIPYGHVLYLRVLTSFMPNDDGCNHDYLSIQGECHHGDQRFCGNANYTSDITWTLGGSYVTLTFHSREHARLYEGMALYFSVQSGTVDHVDCGSAQPADVPKTPPPVFNEATRHGKTFFLEIFVVWVSCTLLLW